METSKPYVEKPKLPEIVKQDSVPLDFKLASDFDRFSNGSILMTITEASFKHPDTGEQEHIRVSMGGNELEVTSGSRRWRVSFNEIVLAALRVDAAFVKENPIERKDA